MAAHEPLAPLLIQAGWVLSITTPPIRDGAVLIQGDCIVAIGKARDVKAIAPLPLRQLDFPDGILLPGLVNPHTHLENTHFANAIEQKQHYARWMERMIELVRAQNYDEALTASNDGAKLLLQAGVTCAGEFSRLGASLLALQSAGLRGVVFKELICLSDSEADERVQQLSAWLSDVNAGEQLGVGVGPHSPITVSPKAFRKAAQLSTERSLPLCVHVAESPDERDLVEWRRGRWSASILAPMLKDIPLGLSPVRYLNWLGVLRSGVLLVHCVQVDDADIAVLALGKAWVTHCPRSNANLQVGIMPLTKMLRAGVKVCLATDGLASAESLSPLDEVRFASQLGQIHPDCYPTLSPEKWLRMVTLDAASALGMEAQVGSLEVGKKADIVVFTINAPIPEPYEALLNGQPKTALTTVDGNVLFMSEDDKLCDNG